MSKIAPHTFVALYSGETIASARLISASADAELVQFAASVMLCASEPKETNRVIRIVKQGRRRALRLGGTDCGGQHVKAS